MFFNFINLYFIKLFITQNKIRIPLDMNIVCCDWQVTPVTMQTSRQSWASLDSVSVSAQTSQKQECVCVCVLCQSHMITCNISLTLRKESSNLWPGGHVWADAADGHREESASFRSVWLLTCDSVSKTPF